MDLYGSASGYEMGNRYSKRLAGVRSANELESEKLSEAILGQKQAETAAVAGIETQTKIGEGINTLEGVRGVAELKSSGQEVYEGLKARNVARAAVKRAPPPPGAEVGAPEGIELTDFAADPAEQANVSTPTVTESATPVESTAGEVSSVPDAAAEGAETTSSIVSEDSVKGIAKAGAEEAEGLVSKYGAKALGAATEGIGGGLQVGMGISQDLHGGFHNMNTAQKIGNVANIAGGSLEMIGAGAMFINPLVGGAIELAGDLFSLFGSGATAKGDVQKSAQEKQEQQETAEAQEAQEQAQKQKLEMSGSGAATAAQTGVATAGQISAQKTIQGTGSF